MLSRTKPSPETQGDRAYRLIRAEILSCRAKPGTKLKISELCTRYEFNLGSVREALSRLGADGLVVAEPQKGYSVTPVSQVDLADLTKARIEIETLCIVDAMTHGDLAWESKILEHFHGLRFLPERSPDDRARMDDEWSVAHERFHTALAAACTNMWLLKVRTMLFEQAERYRRLSIPLRASDRDVEAEHHGILKAVLARDAELVRKLIGEHLNATTLIIVESLNEEGNLMPAKARRKKRL